MSREIKIGVNVGKMGKSDRGISVYTQNILNNISHQTNQRLTLLHYPENDISTDKWSPSVELSELPFSDKHGPIRTIFNEQVLAPFSSATSGLDVIWHPHNRCQFISPGVGYVATIHDVLPLARPELNNQYLNTASKKLLYYSRTLPALFADKIITDSEFSKQEIIRLLSVDPRKIEVIYLGVDKSIFNPNVDSAQKKSNQLKYSLPEKYILTTGSYAPHKNLRTLVDGYRYSNLPKNNIGLVVAGPNNATGYRAGFNDITDYINQIGLTDQVRLLPSIPTTDQVGLYRNAMFFATATHYEGFGFTPLEAMACGTPVVVSDASAIPEVCGHAALYADPNDSLTFSNQFNFLLDDNEARMELIRRGSNQVTLYNWTETSNKTLTTIKSVVGDKF